MDLDFDDDATDEEIERDVKDAVFERLEYSWSQSED